MALSRSPAASNGVVVGEVVECGQHPNADKLRVTKVNVGGERLLDIVCGAPNCRQGLKVAVAHHRRRCCRAISKIKAAKLRGEPSEGMLCSFSELGISDDHSGIIRLPADAPDRHRYSRIPQATITPSKSASRQTAPTAWASSVWRAMSLILNKAPLNAPEITPVAATIDDVLPIQG